MNVKYLILIVAALCVSVSAQADQKAADEAKCEAKCQQDATRKFEACKDVNECTQYVEYEYRSCVHSCDAE